MPARRSAIWHAKEAYWLFMHYGRVPQGFQLIRDENREFKLYRWQGTVDQERWQVELKSNGALRSAHKLEF